MKIGDKVYMIFWREGVILEGVYHKDLPDPYFNVEVLLALDVTQRANLNNLYACREDAEMLLFMHKLQKGKRS